LISNFRRVLKVVCFLLGDSPASEFLHAPTCLWRWDTQCSETSGHKIQTPGIHPKERIQHFIFVLIQKLCFSANWRCLQIIWKIHIAQTFSGAPF